MRRAQRRRQHRRAFTPLRQLLAYQAVLAGMPVRVMDPRNTSRTWPARGTIDARHLRNQAWFQCMGCAFAGLAAEHGERWRETAGCRQKTGDPRRALGRGLRRLHPMSLDMAARRAAAEVPDTYCGPKWNRPGFRLR